MSEVAGEFAWVRDPNTSLAKRVVTCIRNIDPNYQSPIKADKRLQAAYTSASHEKGALGILDLNSYVHNPHQNVAPSDVRAYSGKFGPFIQALDDYLGENRK